MRLRNDNKRRPLCLAIIIMVALTGFAMSAGTASAIGCSSSSKIYGTVYNDINRNANVDAGDIGLAGWTVYLSGLDPCTGTAILGKATTNATGYYEFPNKGKGYYVAFVIAPVKAGSPLWGQTGRNLSGELMHNPPADTQRNFLFRCVANC